ncbi:hypothetical protein KSF73_11550 [Burkholderiaceae bacterium DAT-1]|nr:hypothetical protein [Burkholderiaceae bacterium DAT-1]
MLGSHVIEWVMGMVACFASVSLFTSSIYEALASMLGLRSRQLLYGIRALLNCDARSVSPAHPTALTSEALLLWLYNHPLVHPRGDGQASHCDQIRHAPSYIAAPQFAQALLERLHALPGDSLPIKIEQGIADPQLRRLLTGIVQRSADDVAHMESALATWFDQGMARVSGAYKRQVQAWSFLIALMLAVGCNIDCIHLFKTLWIQQLTPDQLAIFSATPEEGQALRMLNSLPIGWQRSPWQDDGLTWLVHAVGWLFTASSALFGAPFWFDLLSKVTRLRGSGNAVSPRSAT